MMNRLKRLMASTAVAVAPGDPAERVRLAVAALLVEIARADHREEAIEHEAITSLVARYFRLGRGEAAELLAEARAAVENSVSLREFTAPLHQELTYADKQAIIGMLWDVALEDNGLDKYEDYLIGKVAELLYVTRGDVVRLRFEAGQRRAAADR